MVSTDLDTNPSKEMTPATRTHKARWAHTPSNLTLLWLTISLPLVAWDTGYVLLRPWTMPGGALHWPIWVPYDLYGRTDFVYGWKAYNENNGFTSAQGTLNLIESALYMYYLYVAVAYGHPSAAAGRGAPKPAKAGILGEQRFVEGGMGALAVLIAFAASVMTFSKTVLYWLNEYFSGFENIGHNSLLDLIFLWIIPNGLWLAFPAYMIYVSGSEILQGLSIAAGGATTSSADTSQIKVE